MSDLKYIKDNSDSQDDVKKVSIETPDNKPVHLEVSGDLTVKGKINEGHTWYEVVPKGAIIMWHCKDEKVPNGWAICNGENNTPDLRGRFVMGADNYYETYPIFKTKKEILSKAIENFNADVDTKNKDLAIKDKKKHWDNLTKDEQTNEKSDLANEIIIAEKDCIEAHTAYIKLHPNFDRVSVNKGGSGGSPSMIKKKNISGSGLDMSKAEYVSEIDYPPYVALYYIMKL